MSARILVIGAALTCAACTPEPLVQRESAINAVGQPSHRVIANAPLGPVAVPARCLEAPLEAEIGATPSTPLGCASVMAFDATLARPNDRFAARLPGPIPARSVTRPAVIYLGEDAGIGGFGASGRPRGQIVSPPQDEASGGSEEAQAAQ